MVNVNTPIWNFIKTYTGFNDLYFNFGQETDGNSVIAPIPKQPKTKEDILGNKIIQYDFALKIFNDFSAEPNSTANLADLNKAIEFMQWIEDKNKSRVFPVLPNNCIAEKIENLANIPTISTNNSVTQYYILCRFTYTEKG